MKKEEKNKNTQVKAVGTRNKTVPARGTTGPVARKFNAFDGGPITMMRHIAEDMEKLFADFRRDRGFSEMSLFDDDFFRFERDDFFNGFSPPVEMFERDGKLIVRTDLPGMEKDDITVEIHDNRLTIEGERKQEIKEEADNLYRSERSYGSFYRQLPLPESVKAEDARATFKNGVLEITLAAPQLKTKGKRLEITEDARKTKTASPGA